MPIFRAVFGVGIVLITLNAVIVTVLVMRQARDAVEHTAVHNLEDEGVLVRRLLVRVPQAEMQFVLDQLAHRLRVRFTVVAADGSVVADTSGAGPKLDNQANQPEIADALSGRIGMHVRESASVGERWLFVALPPAEGLPFVVRASMAYEPLETEEEEVRDATMAITGGCGAGALLLLLVFARTLDSRLNRAVDARAAAEREHQRAESMFRDFVETTTEWVWAVDEAFTLTYSNPAVKHILGYTPDEILGWPRPT